MDRPTSTRQNAGASEFNLDAPAPSQTETRLATRRQNGKEKARAAGRLTVRRNALKPIDPGARRAALPPEMPVLWQDAVVDVRGQCAHSKGENVSGLNPVGLVVYQMKF